MGQNGGGGHDQRDEELPRGQPAGQMMCGAIGVERAPAVDDRDLETFHSGKQGHESERENRADNRRNLAIGGEVNRAGHPDHGQERPADEQENAEGGARCAAERMSLFGGHQLALGALPLGMDVTGMLVLLSKLLGVGALPAQHPRSNRVSRQGSGVAQTRVTPMVVAWPVLASHSSYQDSERVRSTKRVR